jgi:hypothetical protein
VVRCEVRSPVQQVAEFLEAVAERALFARRDDQGAAFEDFLRIGSSTTDFKSSLERTWTSRAPLFFLKAPLFAPSFWSQRGTCSGNGPL